METKQDASWHALGTAAVVERLRTSELGLSHAEAQQRLHRYGPNQLPARRGRPAWLRFLAQFHNLLIYLLLIAAVVTASMGHPIDTVVILAVVVINAVIGYIQEGRAEQSLEAILSLLTDACMVEREGRRQNLAARDLVPGDVVFIQSGDRIPADMRLLSCRNLRLTESALTGESLSVAKRIEPVAMAAALGDRTCMAFSGTFVATGQGWWLRPGSAQSWAASRDY